MHGELWARVRAPSRLQARWGGCPSAQALLGRAGPLLSLGIFLPLLVNHPEGTSLLGLLLTCTRTFPKLNSHGANKAFSWIRPETIAPWY